MILSKWLKRWIIKSNDAKLTNKIKMLLVNTQKSRFHLPLNKIVHLEQLQCHLISNIIDFYCFNDAIDFRSDFQRSSKIRKFFSFIHF